MLTLRLVFDSNSFLSRLQCSVLPCLLSLLSNPKKGIRKESCWTISNITAGSPDQIQHIIEANLIPPLIHIIKTEEFDIQKEAAWAISNATSGGRDEQIRFMVSQGVIPPLCDLFVCPDAKIVMVAMEGIENILRVGRIDAEANEDNVNKYAELIEECSGLDYLETLQQHDNEEVYNKAVNILKEFYDSDEQQEMEIAGVQQPQLGENGQQFAFGQQQPGNPQDQQLQQQQQQGQQQFNFGG